MIDTYWSDHCRHTTFSTQLDKYQNSGGRAQRRGGACLEGIPFCPGGGYTAKGNRPCSLMDMAVIRQELSAQTGPGPGS